MPKIEAKQKILYRWQVDDENGTHPEWFTATIQTVYDENNKAPKAYTDRLKNEYEPGTMLVDVTYKGFGTVYFHYLEPSKRGSDIHLHEWNFWTPAQKGPKTTAYGDNHVIVTNSTTRRHGTEILLTDLDGQVHTLESIRPD